MLTGARFKDVSRFMLLAVMIASLAASAAGCGDGKTEDAPLPPVIESSPDTSSPSETLETPPPSEAPSETPAEPIETPRSVTPVTAIYTNPLDTVSFYDENFYYAMNPKYKVWYLSNDAFAANEMLDSAFTHWAALMNVEYGGWMDAGGNFNTFIDVLTQLIADGADGMLIDAHNTVYDRAAKLLDESGIPWMSVSTAPRNYTAEDTPLLHPYITGQYQFTGTAIAGKLFAIKDELWPDVPFEKIALLLVGPEVSGAVSGNIQEVTDEWISRTGLAESCFAMAVNSVSVETIMNDTLAQAADFEYYLIYVFADYFADAVNNALDIKGLAPNSAIVSIATEQDSCLEMMFIHWENSQQSALKAMLYMPATLRAEAALGALYAFMSGTATPETIWPSWINQNDKGGENGTFASYCIPYFWLEYNNYKHIIKWTDVYSGANLFPDYIFDIISPYDYEQWRGVPEGYGTISN